MQTNDLVNPAAKTMAANAAVRTIAALVLSGAVVAQMVWMLTRVRSPWGAKLSKPAIIATAIVLAATACVAGLINLSSVILLLRASNRDFVFAKWGLAGPAGAVIAELIVSGAMVVFGWLFAGALMDASSGRVNFVVVIGAVLGYAAILGMVCMRKTAFVSPQNKTVKIAPLTTPILASTISFAELDRLHLGLGSVLRVVKKSGEEIDLGVLTAKDPECIAYSKVVAETCQLPISGVERLY